MNIGIKGIRMSSICDCNPKDKIFTNDPVAKKKKDDPVAKKKN